MKQKLRALAAAMAAVGAIAAVVAAPAMAEEIPAKASATNISLTATNITVKKNGAEPVNCELAAGSATGGIEFGSVAWIKGPGTEFRTHLSCAGGKSLQLDFDPSYLFYDTVAAQYKLRAGNSLSGSFESPWGAYEQGPSYVHVGTWTNGSGTTNSTVSFSEAAVGVLKGGAKVSISGTFTAKTAAGGLITLSH